MSRYLLPHNRQTSSWTEAANTVLAGPESGADAKPAFRPLVAADFSEELKDDLVISLPEASTGTAIKFDIARTYGYAAAETGNITLNSTGLVEGVTQLLIHNHSVEPTFPITMKVISGEYQISVDNYIVLCAVKLNLILVTISQEL